MGWTCALGACSAEHSAGEGAGGGVLVPRDPFPKGDQTHCLLGLGASSSQPLHPHPQPPKGSSCPSHPPAPVTADTPQPAPQVGTCMPRGQQHQPLQGPRPMPSGPATHCPCPLCSPEECPPTPQPAWALGVPRAPPALARGDPARRSRQPGRRRPTLGPQAWAGWWRLWLCPGGRERTAGNQPGGASTARIRHRASHLVLLPAAAPVPLCPGVWMRRLRPRGAPQPGRGGPRRAACSPGGGKQDPGRPARCTSGRRRAPQARFPELPDALSAACQLGQHWAFVWPGRRPRGPGAHVHGGSLGGPGYPGCG